MDELVGGVGSVVRDLERELDHVISLAVSTLLDGNLIGRNAHQVRMDLNQLEYVIWQSMRSACEMVWVGQRLTSSIHRGAGIISVGASIDYGGYGSETSSGH